MSVETFYIGDAGPDPRIVTYLNPHAPILERVQVCSAGRVDVLRAWCGAQKLDDPRGRILVLVDEYRPELDEIEEIDAIRLPPEGHTWPEVMQQVTGLRVEDTSVSTHENTVTFEPMPPTKNGAHVIDLHKSEKPPMRMNDGPIEPKAKPAPQAMIAANENGAAAYTLNEDNIARVFAAQHGKDLRFSHDRARWFKWDGARWREEQTGLAFEYARRLCRDLNIEGKKTFAQARTAAAVERFARSDRAFAVTGEEWDRDPFKLNTPAGTIDLRTGHLKPADPADLITRCTSVSPEEGEPRLWLQFLDQATQGDEELQRLLRQIAGYALTGDTREECFFFAWGPGGSGKGTFTGALQNIMADYAANASMDAFLSSKFERHSTDLAMLRGARLVLASETAEGRAWDEQRIKALTGGDLITARFMRADNFTYKPTFKLLLFGNHKPRLSVVDDAWRRRVNILPFKYQPPVRDLTLKARLREEYPAILAWAIEGALDWLENGLAIPGRVRAESDSYFEEQDVFAGWLETGTIADRSSASTNEALYSSWTAYAEAAGERPESARTLADRLAAHGFDRIKDTQGIRGRGFAGIRLRT